MANTMLCSRILPNYPHFTSCGTSPRKIVLCSNSIRSAAPIDRHQPLIVAKSERLFLDDNGSAQPARIVRVGISRSRKLVVQWPPISDEKHVTIQSSTFIFPDYAMPTLYSLIILFVAPYGSSPGRIIQLTLHLDN